MRELHDAMLWEPVEGDKVQCNLCAHRCRIAPGGFGVCRVRENIGGRLKTHTYDQICSLAVDPIEKKPLFQFLPGTRSLSIATPGCNFRCDFCQNWQISQLPRQSGDDLATPNFRSTQAIPPARLADLAVENHCASISYTYTEPTIFFELAYDTAVEARRRGVKNCFVSNGFMTLQAVQTVAPVLDAINVDLKAFRDETYRTVCGGRLQPVLDCLKELVHAGVWVEVTTLVVPDMNDSEAELRDIAGFIAGSLGAGVPWHVSRFHGDYQRADAPRTPMASLELACRLGREAGLKYVYCGNAVGLADERTYCPACRHVVIDRMGFSVERIFLKEGTCPKCGQEIDGVWT